MKTRINWLMGMGLFFTLQCSGMAGATGNIKLGILTYSTESDAALDWVKGRFSFKVDGRNPGDSIQWASYYDIYGPGSIAELLVMKDWAAAGGARYEEMLLHAGVDYTSAVSMAWKQMDRFDNFEGANGILSTPDGVNFTDLTAAAYSGRVEWLNSMYIGYEEAFDQINLVFATPGSGVTRVWEYWNGSSWAAVTVTDGSSAFTVSGRVSFTPPADWARKVINGSRSKYFVRCLITAAAGNPVTSSIRGDNWLRGAGNLCRGWAATSGNIINSGELKYNPAPPAGSAARFPYQSRISFWSANHFVANPADFQPLSGISSRSWAKYAAYRINSKVTAAGFSGVMCDDGERNVRGDGISAAGTDFADKTPNSWEAEYAAKYRDIVAFTHALNPAIKVGINAQNKSMVKTGDWNLAEYFNSTWKTADFRGIAVTDNAVNAMNYDDYLPVNNPAGLTGVLIYQDTTDRVPGKTAGWDRGNRGPMVALSKHYIGMNDNTIFSYYSKGGYIYSESDEVYLKDASVRHQSVDPIPDVDQVKRWGTYFPAMGVELGTPGARNLLWKSHAEVGGKRDVMRRDFANAVVLHRGATWDTSDSEYNSYSLPIGLDGTYYPLKADGSSGAGITSIALRTGEGAILLKSPQPPPAAPASPPSATKGLKRVQ